jgi:hypothetical protein
MEVFGCRGSRDLSASHSAIGVANFGSYLGDMPEHENPRITARVKCGLNPEAAITVHPQYGHDPTLVHMLLRFCERPVVMDEDEQILEFPPRGVTSLMVS